MQFEAAVSGTPDSGVQPYRTRNVQQRGEVTRAALVDAAVECLVDQGYGATTTIEVARRAGMSRGAQLHHFPTRAHLLAAAVGELYQRRMAEFRDAMRAVEPAGNRIDQAIDLMWELFRGRTFVAWAEVWMAARTDPELRSAVLEIDRRCSDESTAIFEEVFAGASGMSADDRQLIHSFAYVVMDGLAFQALLGPDHYAEPAAVVAALKAIAQAFVPMNQPEEAQ